MPNSLDTFNILATRSRAPELTPELYESVVRSVESAISMNTSEERDEAMRSAYQTITNMTAKSTLIHRGIMSWSQETYEKYGHGNTFVSAMDTSNAVEQLLGEICQELGGNYRCKPQMGMTGQDYMDYIRALANSVTMQDVQNEFFKQATASTLSDSISVYTNNLPSPEEHTYSEDFSVPANRNIAEVYSLYENAWDRIRERGFFGNLAHPIDFFRTVGVIRSAGRILDRFGFNKEIHGPAAKEAFESTVDYCSGKDMPDLAELKGTVKSVEAYEAAKANNIQEVSLARDKLQKAIARENSADSPLNKVNAVLAKYGTAVSIDIARPGRISGFNVMPEEAIAEQYDVRRNSENFRDYVKTAFFHATIMMIHARQEKNEKINVGEIIKDASDIAVMMADDFTVLYEAPDLKDIAKNSAFGGYNLDGIARVVGRAIDTSKHEQAYNMDDIKAEIEQAMAEYKNPTIENSQREKIEGLAEDLNADKPVSDVSKEENTAQKTNETVIEELAENDIMKISVDIFDDAPEVEQVQPQVGEQVLDKSGMSK